MKDANKKIDVLFIGAHQDDVDATVGGTVILLKDRGYKVEILDLTKRKGMYFSDEEIKGHEAEKAAKIMGVKRNVIDLGLLKLANTYESRVKIANFIRQKQPDVVVCQTDDQTHPDHKVAHQLVLDALHYSFATAVKSNFSPWRVKKTYFYLTDSLFKLPPENVMFVDISSTFERKMEALKCYASQFLFHAHNQKYELEYIKVMHRYWGLLIRKEYAEILTTDLPILDPFPELEKPL
ncbi:hypothetical protein A3D00_04630 [Candidatus Woesebacteria bacterium RIFCSPHIGHO2_02_FULL_38_9]|uniref:GlcNAc-PI de-N-acetylase n=1 Tax=Candidatus Woesebacteria bacterium RIFCSPHIGHO2_01_FULL_39_28 TaxID=1802496 RepID=A0A1F7YLC7_9BACT|nr:MAG: hypothetical protein A2627_00455 [Candidatus Woesebacteria bacterium RIFCSPHIGHO2_01_FULL_39_28]OGM31913.1 MAG: hypothetical protein A3D00_04630 [Candidatus Woesebacteria bacterium RIFCSPHIGHO2_02_FULL_38_9]OGM56716.1 MAG: hypothetical protein A3A50_05165 [Candidatus Woesebacteria bacterium RIFCSPLOWO2_01_FULL_38_20]